MTNKHEDHELMENLKAIDSGLDDLKAGRTVDAREAMHQLAKKHGLKLDR